MANNITKQKSRRINEFSHHEIGDDHLYTGLDTPLKKDAFAITDEEKKNKISILFEEIMDIMGLDLTDDSLKGTPDRVAKMYIDEIFSGLNPKNKPKIALFDNKYQYKQMLVEKNITFYSNCEHHFVPIIGKAHVAYISSGNVVFAGENYNNYGALSGRSLDEMISGSRVEVAEYKKNPGDFILWKPSSEKLPGWDSPWGRGRPGWHIECSAMSKKYLGTQFDIHAGGLDLIFPHHENEIAQSCCANKSDIMANYWLHNGYVTSDGEKMSKSLGNFATINNLLLNFRGEAIRYALMQAQYRAPLSFSKKSLDEATKSLSRLYRAVESFEVNGGQDTQIIDNLCDDLNSPKALARLHYLADEANKGSKECAQKLKNSSNILGILCNSTDDWFKFGEVNSNETIENSAMTEKEINELIIKRKIAKENKEYEKADQIREQLLEKNIQLEDKPDRTVWRRL